MQEDVYAEDQRFGIGTCFPGRMRWWQHAIHSGSQRIAHQRHFEQWNIWKRYLE